MNGEFNWGWGAQSPQSTAQPTNRSPCTVGDIPLLTIRPLNDPGATNGFLLSIGSPEGRLLRALRVFGSNLTNHFTSWTVSFIRERLLLIRAQEIPDCQQSRCHHAYDPYQPPLRKFGARKRTPAIAPATTIDISIPRWHGFLVQKAHLPLPTGSIA